MLHRLRILEIFSKGQEKKSLWEKYKPRLLDRYLFGEFLTMFLGTLLMLTTMILVYEITSFMKIYSTSKENPIHGYLYILYSIPGMATQVVSPALMFSTCFVIGQFSVNKELVSIMVAGVSFLRIVFPILLFGVFMWIFVMLASELVVVPFNKKAQNHYSYMLKGTGRITDMVYQYHVKGKEGFYYVYYYDIKAGKIIGGFNYMKMSADGSVPTEILSAQKAIYQRDQKIWTLEDVEEIIFDQDLAVKSYIKYPTKEYDLPESIDYFAKPTKKVSEMNFFELGDEKENRKSKGIPYLELDLEAHSKFAMPMMAFIVVVIGSLTGAVTKKSAGVASLGITIGVVMLYYIFYSTGKSIGENGGIPAWIAIWTTPALFLAGSFVLYRRMNI